MVQTSSLCCTYKFDGTNVMIEDDLEVLSALGQNMEDICTATKVSGE